MLRFVSGIAALLVLLAVNVPAHGRQDAKDDAKTTPEMKTEVKATNATADKMLKAGQISGKLISMDDSKHSIKLEITLSIPKLDAGAANAISKAQADYQNAMLTRDPTQRLQKMQQASTTIAQQQAKLYTYDKKTQQVELQTVEKVVVRAAEPPPAFDEKGSPKTYTAKEKSEMKGPDKKLPGYTSEFGSLTEGQTLMVTLAKKKDDKAVKPPKFKTEEEKSEWLLEHLPQISMIVIMSEPVKK